MADEKKKEGDAKAPEGKKKGLPAIVLVAVGAIVGGAGVVFAVPPKTVEKKVEEPKHKDLSLQHPDLMSFRFNPRMQAGKAFASISFYFVYQVRDDRQELALEQMKANWDRANSNCLLLLKARTKEELGAENGQRVLGKDLVDELDHVLFPARKGEKVEKVARVTEVLWKDWMMQ